LIRPLRPPFSHYNFEVETCVCAPRSLTICSLEAEIPGCCYNWNVVVDYNHHHLPKKSNWRSAPSAILTLPGLLVSWFPVPQIFLCHQRSTSVSDFFPSDVYTIRLPFIISVFIFTLLNTVLSSYLNYPRINSLFSMFFYTPVSRTFFLFTSLPSFLFSFLYHFVLHPTTITWKSRHVLRIVQRVKSPLRCATFATVIITTTDATALTFTLKASLAATTALAHDDD